MVMISVEAVYDGKEVQLLEKPPVNGRYRVVVTFVEPERNKESKIEGLLSSFGAWREDRPVEDMIRDIYESRISRTEPPDL